MPLSTLLISAAIESVKFGKNLLVTIYETNEQLLIRNNGEIEVIGFNSAAPHERVFTKSIPPAPCGIDYGYNTHVKIDRANGDVYLYEKNKYLGRIDKSEKPFFIRDADGVVAYKIEYV